MTEETIISFVIMVSCPVLWLISRQHHKDYIARNGLANDTSLLARIANMAMWLRPVKQRTICSHASCNEPDELGLPPVRCEKMPHGVPPPYKKK